MTAKAIFAIVLAYFLGNISPSTLIGKAMGVDIKKEGSGNAGTTNALRILGKKAGLATLIIDVGKAVLAIRLAYWLCGPRVAEFAFIAVIIGHVFPVIHGFKGGKGVAAGFGAILAIDWKCAIIVLAIAIIGLALTKRMSVGSIAGCAAFPIVVYFLYPADRMPGFMPIAILMALIVIFNHRDNIKRLIRGEEHTMTKTFKKRQDASTDALETDAVTDVLEADTVNDAQEETAELDAEQ